ncbi:MAG: TadE/TadG family type IV pilus assembly protein [Streptosporangiaceae bacterium]
MLSVRLAPAGRTRTRVSWLRSDDGALTLSYVIIIPIFLAGIMVIVQACVWYLARETAIGAARQGADVARTAHPPPGRGAAAAVVFAKQAAPGFLLEPSASAAGSSAATVRIRVTGRVPSLVPGMVLTVSEVVTAPVERFTAASREATGPDVLALARLKAAGGRHAG